MKTTLHYPVIITAMMIAGMQQLHAQYYQRQYNLDYVTPYLRNEILEAGVRTRVNFNNNDTNFYFMAGAGTSWSNYTPGINDSIYKGNRVRFIRNNRAGGVLNNRAYEFRKYNNQKWYNSQAHSIDEFQNPEHNGGYVITGNVQTNPQTGGTPAGGSDILFARLSSSGTVVSSVSIDHSGTNDVGRCIRRSTFFGSTFLICGSSVKSTTRTDMFVTRVDSAGNVLWFKSLNLAHWAPVATSHNIAYSLCEVPIAPDIIPEFWGDIYVVGTYQDNATAEVNSFWLRLNEWGTFINAAIYFSPVPDDDVRFHSVKWTDDNNLIVTGSTDGLASGAPPPGPHTILLKLTPIIGGLMGTRTLIASNGVGPIPSTGYDVIERLNTTGTAEYYISGFCNDGAFTMNRNIVFKTDEFGFPIAQYRYTLSGLPLWNGIDFVNNNLFRPGFALFSSSFNTTNPAITDSYIAKSYFNGCRCTNNCGFEIPFHTGMQAIANSPLYLDTGLTHTVTALKSKLFNYQTISICNQSTIAGGSNAKMLMPDESGVMPVGEMKLFPNPAVDEINVNVALHENQEVKISVYDVSGKLVIEEFAELNAGESQVRLNVEELTKGFYMLHLTTRQKEFRNKFVKN